MMKSKRMAAGGMMKKGYAAGGMANARSAPMPAGGMRPRQPGVTPKPAPMPAAMKTGGAVKKKESSTSSMKMVEKNGKKVPAFAADGVGKMASGGMMKKGAASGGAKSKK